MRFINIHNDILAHNLQVLGMDHRIDKVSKITSFDPLKNNLFLKVDMVDTIDKVKKNFKVKLIHHIVQVDKVNKVDTMKNKSFITVDTFEKVIFK